MSNNENSQGYFLWSSIYPGNGLKLWQRLFLLPLFLLSHSYHCVKGTPVYIQYGEHEHRLEKPVDSEGEDV